MITLKLYGPLEKFGAEHELEVATPAEAVRALCVQLPGFAQTVKEGNWMVFRGEESVAEEALRLTLRDGDVVHIRPAVAGAGNGVGQIVVGVIMVALAWWNPMAWGAVATAALGGAGAGLAMSGIVTMTMKQPATSDYSQRERDKKPSFLFDGPVNTSTQGLPVPVIYGRLKVGSVVISAGITAEEVIPPPANNTTGKVGSGLLTTG